MTGIIALLLGSAVVGLHGQRVLLWLGDRRADPAVLLTGWLLSTVGLVVSVVATVALLALPPDSHPTSGLVRLLDGCWTAISSGTLPGWGQATAAISVVTAASVLGRLAWAIRAELRRQRERAPYIAQLRLLASGSVAGEPLWIRDDRPMAVSFGGRPGLIVMSDALRDHLAPNLVAAALEHERAHLRGRHHALVVVVDTLAAALPICPLLRAAPAAVKDLVELAADDQAARRCGAAPVREALSRLTWHSVPHAGLAMASHLTQARLVRLAAGRTGSSRGTRMAGCTAIAGMALLLPAVTGWAAVSLLGCMVA